MSHSDPRVLLRRSPVAIYSLWHRPSPSSEASRVTLAPSLDPAQCIFTFSAVAIDDAEAFQTLRRARAAHPVQMPELKAGALLESPACLALMRFVLERAAGWFRVVACNNVLTLAGKLFEYIYEPVLQRDAGIV